MQYSDREDGVSRWARRMTLGLTAGAALLTACGGQGGEAEAELTQRPVELTNERPCGDATVAVLEDARGASYVFCASPEGGLLAFEGLPSAAEASKLDEATSLEALFAAVHPPEVPAPIWVTEAFQSGSKPGDQAPYRWKAPVTTVQRRGQALEGSCADPDTFYEDANNQWEAFALEFVQHPWWAETFECVEEVTLQRSSGGLTRYSSQLQPITASGTCGPNARALARGRGNTVLRAFNDETAGGGSYSEIFSFTMGSGGFGKVKYYSNAAKDCHSSQDKDDFRFEAQSAVGASHVYANIFIHEATAIWNNCHVTGH